MVYRKGKYNARKVTTPDGTFDSKREYNRWLELKSLEEAGEIFALQRQVPFQLLPAQREPSTIGKRGGVKEGKVIERGVEYKADFLYYKNGKMVVEDCKGFKTPEYRLKKKMMLYFHGVKVVES